MRAAISEGWKLALVRRPDPRRVPTTAGAFWLALLLVAPCYVVIDFFTADAPRMFSADGIESFAGHWLLVLFVCYLLLRALGREAMLWSFATLFAYAALIPSALTAVAYYTMPEDVANDDFQEWGLYTLKAIWWAAMFRAALLGLAPDVSRKRLAWCSYLAAAVLAIANWMLPTHYFVQTDYDAQYAAENHPTPLVAEDVLPQQPQMLAKAMEHVLPGIAGKPSLYFVAFAPYASQGVFAREAHYTTRQFERDFGARGRTLTLINSGASTSTHPLASVTNLREGLKQLGQKMIPDQDILFLFLTSHGSRDGQMSVDLPDVGLHDLGADDLAGMLDDAGIRWRVIVVSSCYSGTFIPALQNDHTLLITAARADRTSFGCDDKADFTYFGRAYFQQALHQTRDFIAAYGIASKLINQWENEQKIEHAEPQMSYGNLLKARLDAWEATLPPLSSGTAGSDVGGPTKDEVPSPPLAAH